MAKRHVRGSVFEFAALQPTNGPIPPIMSPQSTKTPRLGLSATVLAFTGVGALIGTAIGSAEGFPSAIVGSILGAAGGWSVGASVLRSRRAREEQAPH
ncbi:MAG: hypothetical protein C3F11_02575 [Methylocystaceae bacterium]|nr:MAG: hypothetical protein C3F11_02575 [Methylocystaceae bacterium]